MAWSCNHFMWYSQSNDVPITDHLFQYHYLLDIYPKSSVILFCCLGWSFSIILKSMSSEVDYLHGPVCLQSEEFHHLLYKWKCNNALFSDLMDQFNRCFGPILLCFIGSFFICSTFKFFLTLNYWAVDDHLSAAATLIIILKQLTFFIAVIYVPRKISDEVTLQVPIRILYGQL